MSNYTMYMTHRPLLNLPEGPQPLIEDWVTWQEARNILLERGLAGYVMGIFVMHPMATIEKNVIYV